MKNKTKKILAGACLGLVGMGCLSGCALTADQSAALDMVVEKSDKIITLLEENMELNNRKLTKVEAVERVLLARRKFDLMQFNQFEFSVKQSAYKGAFDNLEDTFEEKWLFRKNGDSKLMAVIYGGEFDSIITSNFQTNEHLEWENGDESFSSREYKTNDFLFTLLDETLMEISEQDVKSVEVAESGYVIKTSSEELNEEDRIVMEFVLNLSFDGYLTSFAGSILFVEEDDNHEEHVESVSIECNIKYDDVDFSAVDAKIASLSTM